MQLQYQFPSTTFPIALSIIYYYFLLHLFIICSGVIGLMQIYYRQMIKLFKRLATTTKTTQKHFHRNINRWHCVCNKSCNILFNNMRNNMQVIMMGKFIFKILFLQIQKNFHSLSLFCLFLSTVISQYLLRNRFSLNNLKTKFTVFFNFNLSFFHYEFVDCA